MIFNRLGILTILLTLNMVCLDANPRGSSAPYISGDSFRAHCDFVYDELDRSFDPSHVKEGQVIFLKTDFLGEFFSNIHPRINAKYILVTHNSDYHVPTQFSHYLDDPKLIAWFGQNLENCVHPKMHGIPIGIANKEWPHGNTDTVSRVIDLIPRLEKNILLYMNIQVCTYVSERARVANMFQNEPYCVNSSPKEYGSYLADLAQSKFVLSPRGNGIDCHRTWEALLMGAYPIVRTSSLDPLFEDLPVLIINDWSEINQRFLEEKYEEMQSKKYKMEKALVYYWLELIDSYR